MFMIYQILINLVRNTKGLCTAADILKIQPQPLIRAESCPETPVKPQLSTLLPKAE